MPDVVGRRPALLDIQDQTTLPSDSDVFRSGRVPILKNARCCRRIPGQVRLSGVAKDTVTAPFRAPFTRFKDAGAPGEVNEEPRQETPAKQAVGELVTCPFCMAQWVGTGFLFGYLLAPRATRAAASLFTIVAASDGLQYAYTALGESVDS